MWRRSGIGGLPRRFWACDCAPNLTACCLPQTERHRPTGMGELSGQPTGAEIRSGALSRMPHAPTPFALDVAFAVMLNRVAPAISKQVAAKLLEFAIAFDKFVPFYNLQLAAGYRWRVVIPRARRNRRTKLKHRHRKRRRRASQSQSLLRWRGAGSCVEERGDGKKQASRSENLRVREYS